MGNTESEPDPPEDNTGCHMTTTHVVSEPDHCCGQQGRLDKESIDRAESPNCLAGTVCIEVDPQSRCTGPPVTCSMRRYTANESANVPRKVRTLRRHWLH